MLQGMLLSAPAASWSAGKSFERVVSAKPAAARHRHLGNFGQVAGGFSLVRAFSWRMYETRAIVGRQMGGCSLVTGRFLVGNQGLSRTAITADPKVRSSAACEPRLKQLCLGARLA